MLISPLAAVRFEFFFQPNRVYFGPYADETTFICRTLLGLEEQTYLKVGVKKLLARERTILVQIAMGVLIPHIWTKRIIKYYVAGVQSSLSSGFLLYALICFILRRRLCREFNFIVMRDSVQPLHDARRKLTGPREQQNAIAL